jgi:nitrogen fixation NifU-like protein
MMSDLDDLYREVILDHNKNPRNRGRLEGADRSAKGYNPLCGDHVTVFLKIRDGRVAEASFEGSGCAISTASASLMTEAVRGRTLDEAKALFEKFHHLVTHENQAGEEEGSPGLGKLAVFSGVCKYPARVKCATLAWHTVNSALDAKDDVVTTE